jgi:hypothetical protein
MSIPSKNPPEKIRYRLGPITVTAQLVGVDPKGIPTYKIVGVAYMSRTV